jgi:hypothetical protein
MQDPIDPDLVRQVLETMPLIRPVPAAFIDAMITESVKVPAGIWRTALAELTAAVPPTETATITAPTLVLWASTTSSSATSRRHWPLPSPDHGSSATPTPVTSSSGNDPGRSPPTSPPSPPSSLTADRPAERAKATSDHAARCATRSCDHSASSASPAYVSARDLPSARSCGDLLTAMRHSEPLIRN